MGYGVGLGFVEWRSLVDTTLKKPDDDRRKSLAVLSQATLDTRSDSTSCVFYRSHGLVNQVSSFKLVFRQPAVWIHWRERFLDA